MKTFKIISLFFILSFSAPLKLVYAEQQFVNIILNLPNAQNYGYFVSAAHSGIKILDGQDLENQKFFTFQTAKQIAFEYKQKKEPILPYFSLESQQLIEPKAAEIEIYTSPIIKIIIDNSWYASWGYKTKRILIVPVNLTVDQEQDDVTNNSYVCELHVEDGKEPGYYQEINLIDRNRKCIQISRGQANSIYP